MNSTDPHAVRAVLAAMHDERPEAIELVETHISWVLLTDQFVYKLKKPVHFDFVDFTTLSQRAQDCRDEMRLNSRMAPGIYLDVLPLICAGDGTLRIGGEGEIVDWMVQMRRLPRKKMLDERIRSGRLEQGEVERLATHLARYYAAAPGIEISPRQYQASLCQSVQDNGHDLFSATPGIDPAQTRQVISSQLRLIRADPGLFARRLKGAHHRRPR